MALIKYNLTKEQNKYVKYVLSLTQCINIKKAQIT